MGWIFRRQLESDFGIDAQVEIANENGPTGQLIALQIKSGESYFRARGSSFVYYGEDRHLSYWENHSLPVILILHNPKTGLTLWHRIERHLTTQGSVGRWSIEISGTSVLNSNSKESIEHAMHRSDEQSLRRQRLALNADIMRRIDSVESAYVVVEEWVNKGLNFRGAKLYFGDPDEIEPDEEIDFILSSNTISRVFNVLFPWLDYEYDRDIEDHSGEVEEHTFKVTLNELGRGFLILEEFYQNGSPPKQEPTRPISNEDWDEAGWGDFVISRSADSDPD